MSEQTHNAQGASSRYLPVKHQHFYNLVVPILVCRRNCCDNNIITAHSPFVMEEQFHDS